MNVHKELLNAVKNVEILMEVTFVPASMDFKHAMMIPPYVLV